MIRSSFAGITTARMAVLASQNGLEVTGQNIANVKTEGYTRQRLDQASFNISSVSLYNKIPDAHIGYGVVINGLSQIRDPFLDARYRNGMGNLGTYDRKLTVLQDLEDVLDEASKEALHNQLSVFSSGLTNLSNDMNTAADNDVRSAAQTLTEFFNLYSKNLETVRAQTLDKAKSDVDAINDILQKIQDLNKSIKNSQTHGNPALELQDSRNSLIDELSTYGKIKVTTTSENLVSGNKIDIIKISMVAGDGTTVNLIDDTKEPAQFSLNEGPPVEVNIKDSGGVDHADFQFLEGSFKSALAMLNESGTFDDPPTATRGIGFYQKMLDVMASTFAQTFNKLNGADADADKALFTSGAGSTAPITAANISVSDKWLTGETRIKLHADTETGGNSNVLKMIAALTERRDFEYTNGGAAITVFSGTFQEDYENISNLVATDAKSTKSILNNYLSIVNNVADSKDSVSGVSLDEETTNMMMFNKSFTAASRLMTALDQMLETIINSMGTVGR